MKPLLKLIGELGINLGELGQLCGIWKDWRYIVFEMADIQRGERMEEREKGEEQSGHTFWNQMQSFGLSH